MAHHQETARLKAMLAAGARISWDRHATRQAAERDVPKFIAERILRRGAVTLVEIFASGEERWRVSGHDTDGRPVDVVVSPVGDDTVRVVTVIRTDE